jgi:N-acetylglucosamine-6-sulfatase
VVAGCSGEQPKPEIVKGKTTRAPRGKPPSGPNVVVFMTDDQNASDLGAMQNVERLLADRGVTFANNYVNFPLCCPSRATYLTGQYAHNHGVVSNHQPDGGYGSLDSSETLPVWATRVGYRTAYVGKYMNGTRFKIPPGWQSWQAKGGDTEYRYFDYKLNQNGEIVEHGSQPRDYVDTVLSGKAADYINRRGPGRRPFFLTIGYLAPHVRAGPDRGCGPQPAPRDEGVFGDRPIPDSPSFDHLDQNKPQKLRLPPLADEDKQRILDRYRCRLESLLEVDRGVARVVRALRQAGELGNTYLMFTSDNGLIQGEHRIKGGKGQPYEEAVRVPLVIRGPGIPSGRTSHSLTVNADLAPTIESITGARPRVPQDGESLLPLARRPSRTVDRTLLIDGGDFTAVRTPSYLYVERESGERELYDLRRDPYELRNVTGERRDHRVERRLARQLDELRDCAGRSCRP